MKVLLLTQYFPPETGAPQNRLYSLAHHLADLRVDVSVLTAMPNYPKMEVFEGYKGRLFIKEQDGPLTIYRSFIYAKRSTKNSARILNYFSFVISSLLIGLFRIGRQDLIICESPPLFLGITAATLKIIKGAKLIFNVSDLWPESVEKLGIVKSRFLLNISYALEKKLYYVSDLVSGQTRGIIENVKMRFPERETFWLPNGIDFGLFDINANGNEGREKMGLSENQFSVIYAGILGHAQGLETVLEAAKLLLGEKSIKFVIIGEGPEKESLIDLAEKSGIDNVIFIPNQPQSKMPGIIAACNTCVVPLRKLNLFLGAIPSKIFEPLAMGKPIILGVDGEARELFIDKGECGLYYEPENPQELALCIEKLYQNQQLARKLGDNGRNFIRANFDRERIAAEFFRKISSIVE